VNSFGLSSPGYYDLIDGKVMVTDLQGRPIGNEEAKSGNDPVVVAKRILRRGRAQRDFFRPISYPPLSLV
jgi:hypothetical protein